MAVYCCVYRVTLKSKRILMLRSKTGSKISRNNTEQQYLFCIEMKWYIYSYMFQYQSRYSCMKFLADLSKTPIFFVTDFIWSLKNSWSSPGPLWFVLWVIIWQINANFKEFPYIFLIFPYSWTPKSSKSNHESTFWKRKT